MCNYMRRTWRERVSVDGCEMDETGCIVWRGNSIYLGEDGLIDAVKGSDSVYTIYS
jgi:hypothetical protein